ncbi:hypothetical protein BHE74_00011261 [Ensete ventricosum]|nr:hypothetical protein BHE74_00011261 [Ensete ventricosum]
MIAWDHEIAIYHHPVTIADAEPQEQDVPTIGPRGTLVRNYISRPKDMELSYEDKVDLKWTGIGKIARNTLGDHQRKTVRLIVGNAGGCRIAGVRFNHDGEKELQTRHGPKIKLKHPAKVWMMRWELARSSLGLHRRYREDRQEHARRSPEEDHETHRRECQRLPNCMSEVVIKLDGHVWL